MTYDNNKTHKKAAFYPLFRRPQAVLSKNAKDRRLKDKFTQLHYSELHPFDNLYMYIYFLLKEKKRKREHYKNWDGTIWYESKSLLN